MIIEIRTVKFIGTGSIDCRMCSHRTVFPDDTQAIVYTEPSRRRQVIRSAIDLTTLHRCGLEYYWLCPRCGLEGSSRYYRARLVAQCRLCRGPLEQHSRRPVDSSVDKP